MSPHESDALTAGMSLLRRAMQRPRSDAGDARNRGETQPEQDDALQVDAEQRDGAAPL